MVSALQPQLFLFENVRHFQAEVKTPQGVFRAADMLEEAIHEVSSAHLRYQVHSRILYAVQHGIPQTRERYFMAGVREGLAAPSDRMNAAEWLLELPRSGELPLRLALEGLPGPTWSDDARGEVRVSIECPRQGRSAADRYLGWVRQPLTGPTQATDGHIARRPREDDQAWFARMGPGMRWMDYRVDGAPTLTRLQDLLTAVRDAVVDDPGLAEKLNITIDAAEQCAAAADGALALRLLLECIEPHAGELGHHLLADGYLAKAPGNHGDWMARLAADRPCKTITSHMGKDTYAYVHPYETRTLSLREAARVQSFPDWFSFGMVSLVDGYRIVGNAVPPLLSHQLAERAAHLILRTRDES